VLNDELTDLCKITCSQSATRAGGSASVRDEVSDEREGPLGRVGDHAVAAVRKPRKPDKMLGQCSDEVLLTLNRGHRVFFATENERRTLDLRQHREEVKRPTLAAWSREPVIDVWAANNTL
jgi:hypothetical protein